MSPWDQASSNEHITEKLEKKIAIRGTYFSLRVLVHFANTHFADGSFTDIIWHPFHFADSFANESYKKFMFLCKLISIL